MSFAKTATVVTLASFLLLQGCKEDEKGNPQDKIQLFEYTVPESSKKFRLACFPRDNTQLNEKGQRAMDGGFTGLCVDNYGLNIASLQRGDKSINVQTDATILPGDKIQFVPQHRIPTHGLWDIQFDTVSVQIGVNDKAENVSRTIRHNELVEHYISDFLRNFDVHLPKENDKALAQLKRVEEACLRVTFDHFPPSMVNNQLTDVYLVDAFKENINAKVVGVSPGKAGVVIYAPQSHLKLDGDMFVLKKQVSDEKMAAFLKALAEMKEVEAAQALRMNVHVRKPSEKKNMLSAGEKPE